MLLYKSTGKYYFINLLVNVTLKKLNTLDNVKRYTKLFS